MQNFARLKLRQTKNKSVGSPLPFPLKDVFVDFISIKKPEKLLFISPVASECLPRAEQCLFNLLQKLDTIQKEQFSCIKFLACDKGERSQSQPQGQICNPLSHNPSTSRAAPRAFFTCPNLRMFPRMKHSVLLFLAREPAERPRKQGLSLPFSLARTC